MELLEHYLSLATKTIFIENNKAKPAKEEPAKNDAKKKEEEAQAKAQKEEAAAQKKAE